MHIVIFFDYNDKTVGGVQTSVRGQRAGLEQAGHTVTIVCPPALGEQSSDPATIIVPATPFAPNGFPMVIASRRHERQIEKKLQARPPIDIIHAQTNVGVGIMGVRIAKRLKVPLFQTMHGRDDVFAEDTYPLPVLSTTILSGMHRLFIPHDTTVPRLSSSRAAYNAWIIMANHAQAADHVVMPSQHFYDKFRARGVTKPISVVSNGLEDAMLKKLRKSTRKRTNSDPLRAVWCGRISAEKRPLVCLEAIKQLSNVTLDIYGDGSQLEAVKDYIAQHDLADRVKLMGVASQTEIIEAMTDHDVLLYSSYGFDNQPMVLLEAVAAGLPVIYCDPDLTECMPAGGALLTNDALAAGFTAAIEQLLAHPDKLQALKSVMESSAHTVTQSQAAQKMLTLYENALQGTFS